MASPGPRVRSSFRSRLGQLNPAFASAHGIPSPASKSLRSPPLPEPNEEQVDRVETTATRKPKNGDVRKVPVSPSPVRNNQHHKKEANSNARNNSNNNNNPPTSNDARAKQLIGKARTNGKLQASDAGLKTPLPNILFDFPSLVDTVDLSLDQTNPDQLKPWESHVAETLTVVDFSDNEGITEFPSLEPSVDKSSHTSWNSVERFRSVSVFRARRCQLSAFPVTRTMRDSWSQLTTLDLSGNALKGEFPLIYLPKSIRELDVSGNRLSSLKSSEEPSTSIQLPQLVSLDISSNDIASTGISPIMHMPSLQRLHCGDNKIYNLNFILKAIASSEKSLTTLHAPKCLLSDLDGAQPIDLASFVSLLSIDLSHNSLCRVPKIAPAVQRLCVSHNSITGIHGLLAEDSTASYALAVLQIQSNKVAVLCPTTVAKLTELHRFDLQYNALKDLPYELGYLNNLQHMCLDGNHLLSLRSSGLRCDLNDITAVRAKLRNRGPKTTSPSCSFSNSSDSDDTAVSAKVSSKATKNKKTFNADVGGMLASSLVGTKAVDYSTKHAQVLPFQLLDEIKTSSPDIVHNIERLDVSKNQLQTIEPEWFTLLPRLTTLQAHDNRLSSLPESIQGATFTHLYLSRNRLSAYSIRCSMLQPANPRSITIANTLQHLDLSSNNLESFPPELLQNFKALHTLNLSRNRISSLQNIVDSPHSLSCHSLEFLNLSENQLEDLGGDEFPLMLAAGAPDIQSLNIENNDLQVIPMTLGLLESLRTLELRGNPQRMIRHEILEKSTSSVLEFMRNRMTAKTKGQALKRLRELLQVPSPDPNEEETTVNPANDESDDYGVDTNTENNPRSTMRQTKMVEYSPAANAKKKNEQTSNRSTSSKKALENNTPSKASTPSKIPPPKTRHGLSPVVLTSRSSIGTPPPSSGAGKPRRTSNMKSPLSPAKKLVNDFTTSPLLQDLEKTIAELAEELDRPGLSEPKRYAIKKNLAMERSKRLREERRLKQERDHRSAGTRGYAAGAAHAVIR